MHGQPLLPTNPASCTPETLATLTCLRVLYGEMFVQSYDWCDDEHNQAAPSRSSGSGSGSAGSSSSSLGGGARAAKMVLSQARPGCTGPRVSRVSNPNVTGTARVKGFHGVKGFKGFKSQLWLPQHACCRL